MRVCLAQMNSAVGDLVSNKTAILEAAQAAKDEDMDIIVFPANALTGWPLKGLMLSQAFLEDAKAALADIAMETPITILISCITAYEIDEDVSIPVEELFILDNSMPHSLGIPALADEDESFGVECGCDGISIKLGEHFEEPEAEAGDTVLLEMCCDAFDDPCASPAQRGELDRIKGLAAASGMFVAYVNPCGGSDATVFGGGTLAVTPQGELLGAASLARQELIFFDTKPLHGHELADEEAAKVDSLELMWQGAVVATRDYVVKNGFSDVVIGLSGGIDSAITAAIAVDALGKEHVHGVLMPSKFSSEGSIKDSEELAANLGFATMTLPINELVESAHQALGEACGGQVTGLAAENLQARIRTLYLMTISNAQGWMVLNTGNKSEACMGFSTLYGDTAGAYAPVGELYKTEVYALAEWRAQQGPSIPQACITKAPSAELYDGAKDEDRLPPYAELDGVLYAHVEQGLGARALAEDGYDPSMIDQVVKTVQRNEYKRRNEPIAPLLGGVSMTGERDWPITNGWKDRR